MVCSRSLRQENVIRLTLADVVQLVERLKTLSVFSYAHEDAGGDVLITLFFLSADLVVVLQIQVEKEVEVQSGFLCACDSECVASIANEMGQLPLCGAEGAVS